MRLFLAALRATATPADDGELLDRFCRERDEHAFAELIRRHGPLVWGVCRRSLPNPNDAEDAFQATFLVLVRRVEVARTHPALGAWLYHVARHTVRRRQRTYARHDARQTPFATEPAVEVRNPIDARHDVDALLDRLPSRLRHAVVLCHLQGFTRAEAAKALGCPEGTLSANLAAALKRLRKHAGSDVGAVLAVAGSALLPPMLPAATVRAAGIYLISSVGVSSTVLTLTEGVLHMFWLKKCVTAVTVAVLGVGLAVGVGLGVGAAGPGDEPKKEPTKKAEQKPRPTPLDEKRPVEKDVEKLWYDKELIELRARLEALKDSQKHLDLQIEQVKQMIVDKGNQPDCVQLFIFNDNAAWGGRYGFTEVVGNENYHASIFDAASLNRHLKRMMADPQTPKEFVLIVKPETPWSHVRAAVEALKAVGVKQVRYSGQSLDQRTEETTLSLDRLEKATDLPGRGK